jgi:hypothetical protein
VLFAPLLLGTILFGLFHGVNPSHGWPIATLYSIRSKRPFVTGFISSSILASAHFVSSIIVVLAYILVSTLIEIPQIYLQYGAAIGLGILAVTVAFGERNLKTMLKPSMNIFTMMTLASIMTLVTNMNTGIKILVTILMNTFIK